MTKETTFTVKMPAFEVDHTGKTITRAPGIDSSIKDHMADRDMPDREIENGGNVTDRDLGNVGNAAGRELGDPLSRAGDAQGSAPEATRGAITEGLGMARDTGDTGDSGNAGVETPEEAARRMSQESFEMGQNEAKLGEDGHSTVFYTMSAKYLSDAQAMANNQEPTYFSTEFYAGHAKPKSNEEEKPAPENEERPAPDDAGDGGDAPVEFVMPERGDVNWGDSFVFSDAPMPEATKADILFNPSVDPVDDGEEAQSHDGEVDKDDFFNPSVDPVDEFMF